MRKIPGLTEKCPAVLPERDGEVFASIQRFWGRGDLHTGRAQKRRGIAETEWSQRKDLRGTCIGEIGQSHFGVYRILRTEIVGCETRGRKPIEAKPEIFDGLTAQRKSGSLPVAAKFLEQLGHALECFEQMKSGDAAAGAGQVRRAIVIQLAGFAEYKNRPHETFDKSAGDNAEDAEVPACSRENKRGAVIR